MNIYSNIIAQKIYDILSPLVGDVMAKSTLRIQTNNIGCKEDTLQQKDLPKLAEAIRKGLVIFIGSDTASKVADKITQLN